MNKKVLITMDVEPDISKYLKNSYIGVEKGLPPFLELLDNYEINVDFFITSDMCKRYPKLIKKTYKRGYSMGSHGFDHSIQFYNKMNYERQKEDILRATKEMERCIGVRPTMFRTPNFSINEGTLRALEQLDYEIDSSILPGRFVKKWKIFPVLDHRRAPQVPYNPSTSDPMEKGDSSVLEIPLTENPHLSGAPLGMGYLNYAGLKKTIAAVNEVKFEYVTFLIHPWELIDLRKYHPNLKSWVYDICSSDLKPLESLFEYIDKNYEFTTLEMIKDSLSKS